MFRRKSRHEDIGWICALPDGSIGLYSRDVADDPTITSDTQAEAYRVVAPRGLTELSAPITAALELTLACNLTCTHCYIDAGAERVGELGTRDVISNAQELADAGVMFVFLTGGEVTLRPDFVDIVRGVHETGLDFNIISNTSRLSQQRLSKLPRDTTFVVSIDGTGAHQLIRGRQTFSQVSARILGIREAGYPVIGSVVVNRLNVAELPDLYEWARTNRVILTALDLQTVGRAQRNAEVLRLRPDDLDAYRRFLDAKFTYEANLENYYEENFTGDLPHSNPFYYGFEEQLMLETGLNYQGNFYVYVAADGTMYPDNFYAGDALYPAGRLRDADFKDLWEKIRESVRPSNYDSFDCAGCPVHEGGIFCDFKSAALSLYLTGTPNTCGADPVEKQLMLMRTSARSDLDGMPTARHFDNF
jgi:MoaA/NifB/PqqE/SkfB family radical SAM enzyme